MLASDKVDWSKLKNKEEDIDSDDDMEMEPEEKIIKIDDNKEKLSDIKHKLKKIAITSPQLTTFDEKKIDNSDYDTLYKEYELCSLRQSVNINKLITAKALDVLSNGIAMVLQTPTLPEKIREDEALQKLVNNQLTIQLFDWLPDMVKFGVLMSSHIVESLKDNYQKQVTRVEPIEPAKNPIGSF